MRLKMTFDFRTLQRLCTELGGGTVSVETVKTALQEAIDEAWRSKQIPGKKANLTEAFSNVALKMQPNAHTVLADINPKFLTSCGQKQDQFPKWIQKLLFVQAEECSSTGHPLADNAITVEIYTPL